MSQGWLRCQEKTACLRPDNLHQFFLFVLGKLLQQAPLLAAQYVPRGFQSFAFLFDGMGQKPCWPAGPELVNGSYKAPPPNGCAWDLTMSGGALKGTKHSSMEVLLEALMWRMDAMDQTIASLKVQYIGVPVDQEERPQRADVPAREAIPPVLKRAWLQGKHKLDLVGQAAGIPSAAGGAGHPLMEGGLMGLTPVPSDQAASSGQVVAQSNVTAVNEPSSGW
ncbi:hypothetical protein NDU88_004810 [Pleurodeles waltl]|uniref:Uncharacterized protein n=1 Tax=Pleurodeles waltl TaxID=8319 RepID=A0AAV7RJS6_PLEWA|nr:hypothetical protein NDU88_004810 [Pleurodeles waltl]